MDKQSSPPARRAFAAGLVEAALSGLLGLAATLTSPGLGRCRSNRGASHGNPLSARLVAARRSAGRRG